MKSYVKSRKKIILAVIGLIIIATGSVGAFLLLVSDAKPAGQVSTNQQQVAQPAAVVSADTTNKARELDASSLATAIVLFQTTNKGKIPSAWTPENTLMGVGSTPIPVKLATYRGVIVAVGKQDALKADNPNLIMVIQSKCAENGATIENFTGVISVQYVVDSKPKCISTRTI